MSSSSSSSSSSVWKRDDSGLTATDVNASFASGFVAGFLVKTATAPLSRLTILLQTAPIAGTGGSGPTANNVDLRTIWRDTVRREGLASFWKGNWASILQKGTATGLNYVFFESLKDVARPLWRSEDDVGIVARTAAGFGGGVLSLLFSYPFDIVRTRLACDPQRRGLRGGIKGTITSGAQASATSGASGMVSAQLRHFTSSTTTANTSTGVVSSTRVLLDRMRSKSLILDTWLAIVREEGSVWGALRRGLPCTLLCQGANMGLGFGIYETLNVHMLSPGETRTGFLHCITCGAVAGLVSSVATHPLDLIRRRQQMVIPQEPMHQESSTSSGPCSHRARSKEPGSVWAIAREIYGSKQGLRGFFRGLLPELLKVVPAVGLNFWIYEYLRQECFGTQVRPR
ncbi:unnamed protein product [Amoebophrya sp. A25]|nr:unnamed protein product [Amoebophrya sp. A25]|eukprot:GSA25T00018098001.1